MTKKNKKAKLTAFEKELLLSTHPEPGDLICLVRHQPHVSSSHPFLHLDLLYFRYVEGDHFIYIKKEHEPYSGAIPY